MINKENKKIIIAVALFIVLCLVMIFIAVFNNIPSKRDYLEISNFNEYVENIPNSEKRSIEEAIHHVVTLNTEDSDRITSDTKALIRSNTYSQSFKDDIYETKFIIDIDDLRQSYLIENFYSDLSMEESGLTDYTVSVLCLPPEDMVYDGFGCVDRISQESGLSESDPILRHLPYSTLDYTITAYEYPEDHDHEEDGHAHEGLSIQVDVLLSEADYKTGVAEVIYSYEEEVEDWIESLGLNPDNYNIEYVF